MLDFIKPNPIVILQENHLCYPTVFALVMDVLPIQGSSVPCEWVFLSAKETLTDHWSCVVPELMEGLQLLKYLVQHGCSISFMAKSSWDNKVAALETLMNIDSNAPENLKAYQRGKESQSPPLQASSSKEHSWTMSLWKPNG